MLGDAADVMLTLATNTPLVDGLAPDRVRIRKDFPYYGAPYTAEEQVRVTPMPHKKEAGLNRSSRKSGGRARLNWSADATPIHAVEWWSRKSAMENLAETLFVPTSALP